MLYHSGQRTNCNTSKGLRDGMIDWSKMTEQESQWKRLTLAVNGITSNSDAVAPTYMDGTFVKSIRLRPGLQRGFHFLIVFQIPRFLLSSLFHGPSRWSMSDCTALLGLGSVFWWPP
jgi:hypothetical protein